MGFIKFSFFIILFISSALAQTRFSPKSCLDSKYKMKMVQQGPLFGLFKQEFTVDKKDCLIHIIYHKYFPKEWFIDICREPVHIKVTSATGVDVAKKEAPCINVDKTKNTSDFCSQVFNLLDVIQDDGLIFAEGDRDNLNSNHGKTYCAYLLLKKYLNESIVFSRYTEVPDIFQENSARKSSVTSKVIPEAKSEKNVDKKIEKETSQNKIN